MPSLRLASDLVVEPLDEHDTAVHVPRRGDSHVVDAVGAMLLARLGEGEATEDELAHELVDAGTAPDHQTAVRYLSALVALWRGVGILEA